MSASAGHQQQDMTIQEQQQTFSSSKVSETNQVDTFTNSIFLNKIYEIVYIYLHIWIRKLTLNLVSLAIQIELDHEQTLHKQITLLCNSSFYDTICAKNAQNFKLSNLVWICKISITSIRIIFIGNISLYFTTFYTPFRMEN